MILVLDNYDSFTYNLVQYVGSLGAEVVVRRNDVVSPAEIVELAPDGILLSPGPCTPSAAGVCLHVLAGALGSDHPDYRSLSDSQKAFFASTPVFGVCLGMQSVAFVAGGTVERAKNIMHGKTSMIRHDGKGVFKGIPSPFRAVRYHSLVIRPESLGPEYEVSATSEDDGEIMGVRHKSLPIEGVQFHPESVLTEHGMAIIQNFLDVVDARTASAQA